jgi:potassium-transporting ATPase ATP-binding subunit
VVHKKQISLFDTDTLVIASVQALKLFHPLSLLKNPVMFTTEIGAIVVTFLTLIDLIAGASFFYSLSVSILLWITLYFANFAEAIAEARGKAQAASLKLSRKSTLAHRKTRSGDWEDIGSNELREGDVVLVKAGEVIPGDGEIIEGLATIDESAITGESAPVLRESGTDRSGVTGGTKVLTDQIEVQITASQGNSFLDKMISLVEGAKRQKTPNELALTVVLASLTLAFLVVVVTLYPIALFYKIEIPISTLVALLICLIPTTIGALLAAIGISGMDRALKANIIAKSGKAVELAGDVDTLLVDKTGTITIGDRQATKIIPLEGVKEIDLMTSSYLSSLGDKTPEGKSIIKLVQAMEIKIDNAQSNNAKVIEFSATTRMSGVDLQNGKKIRKGAVDAIIKWVNENKGSVPDDLERKVESVAIEGATPVVVASENKILGVIALSDVLKKGMNERIQRLRKMGIKVVMLTGDNRTTASVIAANAGVDDFIAEAKPEDKMDFIKNEQKHGRIVAMMGDGTNDAPALAQADIGVAMNSGTQAAKEASNMVDLDSDPTKLIEVVEIGKQLLMTRGALTTFSLANDIAKYFAIVPAMFMIAIPGLSALNIMHLSSPQSAILSSLIFNAIIIPLLVPLALRGVKYVPLGADALLKKHLFVYGFGGLLTPFIGIKLIDVVISSIGFA